jgi:transposase-like protein
MVRKKQEPNPVDVLLDELLEEHKTPEEILGESGLLKQLTKRLIKRALSGELNAHLNNQKEEEKGNSRNGYSRKTVQSNQDEMEIAIPRDRESSFEPVLVPKHQRRIAGLDEKILGLYARGMSTRDIRRNCMGQRCQPV